MQSNEHIELVSIVHKFFKQRYYSIEGITWSIARDIPSSPRRPTKIQGCIPDYEAWSKHYYIVGEAKLPPDLMTKRSRNQIQTFVSELANRKKKTECIYSVCSIQSY